MKPKHFLVLLAVIGCAETTPDEGTLPGPAPVVPDAAPPPPPPPAAGPTVADAVKFVADTNAAIKAAKNEDARANWIYETFINKDTEAGAARTTENVAAIVTKAVTDSAKYRDIPGLPPETARSIELIRRQLALPYPIDAAKRGELADLSIKLQGIYGAGTYCSPTLKKYAPKGATKPECLHLDDLSNILANPKATFEELTEAWVGWRTVSAPMRKDYVRLVELTNQGAKDTGFPDAGAVWRAAYDMSPAELEADVDRLWKEVRPLYRELRCYAGKRLRQKWGAARIPSGGLYPQQVFGNMWGQEWGTIYDLLAPYPKEPSIDSTKSLVKKKFTAKKMTEVAEQFFVSLGLPKLPATFWERSMLVRPRDREVVCHASAWSMDYDQDVRIKMCIEQTEEDLKTLHHELGHLYYDLAYVPQPTVFAEGANDGFHEAIGDTLSRSVTPKYLAEVGILDAKTAQMNDKAVLNLLMNRAIDRVSFLPFAVMIDKWRWDVFAGKITPDRYNAAWWQMVKEYQGMAPAEARDERFFDPGAKYHIASQTSYLRYFLAAIYQFQFHRALCQTAGHKGPLHECSIYGNKAAGEKLWKALQMGASKPWPDAMEAITGQRKADAGALLEYFAPLRGYLQEQIKGENCDW